MKSKHNVFIIVTFLVTLLTLCFDKYAQAVVRYEHDHDDIITEKEFQFGPKIGPQLTDYSPIRDGDANIMVKSTMRALAGLALKFVWSFPRLEIDAFLNARGGLNTGKTYFGTSIPILLKLPWDVSENVDLEFAGGYQQDILMSGPQPFNRGLSGTLAGVGVSADFESYIFEFELRYNIGLRRLSRDINGARPNDLQILVGILWHY